MPDVLAEIATGESLLWWDAPTQTAAITQPIWPDEMSIHLLGGKMDKIKDLEASCVAWCRSVGITKITITDARKGWSRFLRPLGYTEQDGELVKEL